MDQSLEITVTGTGKVSLPPERATVHLSVGFETPNQQEALDRTTATLHEVVRHIDYLKGMTPSPTTWSSVGAIGTRSWRPFQTKGVTPPPMYAAKADVQVKFRDQGALAYFVDTWAGQPGVTVRYVEWALTEQVRLDSEADALGRAVAKATERARVIAKAGGFSDVRLVEVADPGLLSGMRTAQGGSSGVYAMSARSGAPAGSSEQGPVEITPEDIDIQSTVHGRFVAFGERSVGHSEADGAAGAASAASAASATSATAGAEAVGEGGASGEGSA